MVQRWGRHKVWQLACAVGMSFLAFGQPGSAAAHSITPHLVVSQDINNLESIMQLAYANEQVASLCAQRGWTVTMRQTCANGRAVDAQAMQLAYIALMGRYGVVYYPSGSPADLAYLQTLPSGPQFDRAVVYDLQSSSRQTLNMAANCVNQAAIQATVSTCQSINWSIANVARSYAAL